jgi:hypothetical protein
MLPEGLAFASNYCLPGQRLVKGHGIDAVQSEPSLIGLIAGEFLPAVWTLQICNRSLAYVA